MSDVVDIVLFCLVTAFLLGATHACTTWVLALTLGASVRRVGIGFPALYRRAIGGTSLELGPIPLYGFVELVGMNPLEERRDPGDWRDLDTSSRLAIICAPWLCIGMLTLAFLPAPRAVGSFVHTFAQLAPWHDAKALWEGFFRLLRTESLGVVFSVVATKYVAVNLLPLPSLAGGQILTELVATVFDSGERSARRLAFLRIVSTFIMLTLWLNLVVGLVRALIAL